MQVFRAIRHNTKQWTQKNLFPKRMFRPVLGHHIQHWFSKGVSQHTRVTRNSGWHIIAGKIKFINGLKAWWFKIRFTYTHVVQNKCRFRKLLTLYIFIARVSDSSAVLRADSCVCVCVCVGGGEKRESLTWGISGVHKLSENLRANSKFWAQERWHEPSPILRTHKH